MLKFVLLVNKQGQTRLSQYYEYSSVEERVITEADIIRKCLARTDEQVCEGCITQIVYLVRLSGDIVSPTYYVIHVFN